MYVLKLIIRNAFRHRLRTLLTMLGIVIAVLAFGLLQTVVDAWYAGANAASSTRLVTRNAISLVFSLPMTYEDRIRQVAGVKTASRANWFGGVYIDKRNFFSCCGRPTVSRLILNTGPARYESIPAGPQVAWWGASSRKPGWKPATSAAGTIYPATEWPCNSSGRRNR
jgi:hypothetical protein